mmetsp:Transcript_4486/g.8008  ORF Transcript_4486/g.8008 Transcript_4486/m.8008 type:complete len:278 (-) Transcript_4486:143-976(-)
MMCRFWLAVIFSCIMARTMGASDSLDGYAFNCGGTVVGFKGSNDLQCQALTGSIQSCGTYVFKSEGLLAGSFTVPSDQQFATSNLEFRDGILVSYSSTIVNFPEATCIVVSLDWPRYSVSNYMGLKCPTQNAIVDVSVEENHASLGASQDVAFRSALEMVGSSGTTTNGNTITRDSYGVYQWFGGDSVIRMYFGPQQGRPLQVISGTLTSSGFLSLDGYSPTGPCTWDQISPISTVSTLPQLQGKGSAPSFQTEGGIHMMIPIVAAVVQLVAFVFIS